MVPAGAGAGERGSASTGDRASVWAGENVPELGGRGRWLRDSVEALRAAELCTSRWIKRRTSRCVYFATKMQNEKGLGTSRMAAVCGSRAARVPWGRGGPGEGPNRDPGAPCPPLTRAQSCLQHHLLLPVRVCSLSLRGRISGGRSAECPSGV